MENRVRNIAIPETSSTAQSARPRLAGVDGLRAIAALWVVLFHIQAFSGGQFRIPGLNLFLRSGSTGVSLFLVLSGFCLYIPFAGGRQHRFRAGEFFMRRCRRLMPAYFVSLAFATALYVLAGPRLGFASLSPAQLVLQVGAHAALIHTLFPATFYQLNGAYWSLGLEWQLYLALPLLIWSIRRFGIPRTLSAAVACNVVYGAALALVIHRGVLPAHGALASYVLPNQLPGRWAEFVFGMLAAELYVTGRLQPWARRAGWLIPILIPIAILISGLPLSHLVYGAVFFSLLSLVLVSGNIVSKVAEWRPLVAIGTMSYSLYLVHQPIVQGLAYFARAHGGATPQETFLVLLAFIPAIMGVAWLLFRTVERRTMTSGRRPVLQPTSTPVTSDAPVALPRPVAPALDGS
jgi:peptidoglycan/LPS O-acetylase OafA/YrhL